MSRPDRLEIAAKEFSRCYWGLRYWDEMSSEIKYDVKKAVKVAIEIYNH